jgi:hypothetical protein
MNRVVGILVLVIGESAASCGDPVENLEKRRSDQPAAGAA